jgi:hypothetical protein
MNAADYMQISKDLDRVGELLANIHNKSVDGEILSWQQEAHVIVNKLRGLDEDGNERGFLLNTVSEIKPLGYVRADYGQICANYGDTLLVTIRDDIRTLAVYSQSTIDELTALNLARATVASASTTADIWAAAGNDINYTGTVTTTGFPAAPQAGTSRDLICAAAASFTAGANMLIDGVTSGNTYHTT